MASIVYSCSSPLDTFPLRSASSVNLIAGHRAVSLHRPQNRFDSPLSRLRFMWCRKAAFSWEWVFTSRPAANRCASRKSCRGACAYVHRRCRERRPTPVSQFCLCVSLNYRPPILPPQVGAPITQASRAGDFFRTSQPPLSNGSIQWRSSYFPSLSLSGTASLDGLTA